METSPGFEWENKSNRAEQAKALPVLRPLLWPPGVMHFRLGADLAHFNIYQYLQQGMWIRLSRADLWLLASHAGVDWEKLFYAEDRCEFGWAEETAHHTCIHRNARARTRKLTCLLPFWWHNNSITAASTRSPTPTPLPRQYNQSPVHIFNLSIIHQPLTYSLIHSLVKLPTHPTSVTPSFTLRILFAVTTAPTMMGWSGWATTATTQFCSVRPNFRKQSWYRKAHLLL